MYSKYLVYKHAVVNLPLKFMCSGVQNVLYSCGKQDCKRNDNVLKLSAAELVNESRRGFLVYEHETNMWLYYTMHNITEENDSNWPDFCYYRWRCCRSLNNKIFSTFSATLVCSIKNCTNKHFKADCWLLRASYAIVHSTIL